MNNTKTQTGMALLLLLAGTAFGVDGRTYGLSGEELALRDDHA